MIEEPDDRYRNVEITGSIPPELDEKFVESLEGAGWDTVESCVIGSKGMFTLAEDGVLAGVMVDTFQAIRECLVVTYKQCISNTFDELSIGFLRACDVDVDDFPTLDLDDAIEKERQRLVEELRAAPKP